MSKNVIKLIFSVLMLAFYSCQEEVYPKPKAYLNLEYPKEKTFIKTELDCPYNFEVNSKTILEQNEKCWLKIKYPKLKANIDITYKPVKKNLRKIFIDAEKLTTKHSVKADEISFIPFVNPKAKVYGKITDVTGNAASPVQFYLTDSTNHFLTGALYFNVTPNYDSIYPSIKYIEKDIVYLMETLQWKNKNIARNKKLNR